MTKPVDDNAKDKSAKPVTELRASRRDVVIGSEQSQHTVIISGVQVGERVATNGSFKLRDGMLTYVKEKAADKGTSADKAAPAAPSATGNAS